jgi:hypothetical protein
MVHSLAMPFIIDHRPSIETFLRSWHLASRPFMKLSFYEAALRKAKHLEKVLLSGKQKLEPRICPLALTRLSTSSY